jgi:hypothetical protein
LFGNMEDREPHAKGAKVYRALTSYLYALSNME